SSGQAPPAGAGGWAQTPAPSHWSRVQTFESAGHGVPPVAGSWMHVPAPSQCGLIVQTFASVSGHGLPLGSTRQPEEQQSPFTMLPSSHSSAPATTPSPQPVGVHVGSHPSPDVRFPSSHTSPGSSTPLPQSTFVSAAAFDVPKTMYHCTDTT